MIDAATVTNGLAPVRELLQPDGAEVELIGVAGGTVRLRLSLENAECTDTCVMPRAIIETVALQLMQPLVPGLTAVVVEDPREA
jgi:hypothetical protein